VLAVFERACDLVTPGGPALSGVERDVVALVLPEIGNGPLNIVVERLDQSLSLRLVQSGMTATLHGARLRIGDLEIALDRASVWEPRPDWARLRQNRERIESRLLRVRDLALRQAPAGSLLDLTGSGIPEPVRSDLATQFAGLGGGLTPAGDDFLMGVMLRAWLAHPQPEAFCQELAEVAVPRTTTLSAALLRAAARGECSATWHTLLDALQGESKCTLTQAVAGVLSYGHTSGADSLAGFLWLGCHPHSQEMRCSNA
jgi:hypothetical protein